MMGKLLQKYKALLEQKQEPNITFLPMGIGISFTLLILLEKSTNKFANSGR